MRGTAPEVSGESEQPVPAPLSRRADEGYVELVQRLSVQSVKKHFDAYADVPWDAPEHEIRPDDPRWELSIDTPCASLCRR
ncbi:MAG TPA: diiron oxygenase [Polyangiales bacterium]